MQLLRPGRAEESVSDEELLVRRVIVGDANAFADLYEQNLVRVFRYFYYRVGQREDAEDLTEQAFLKAWQAIGNYDYRGVPFSAWLFRIAYNLLIDRSRKFQETAPFDEALEVPSDGDTPFDSAVKHLDAEDLVRAIKVLSDVEQTTLILRFVEGLDHRTVAGIIGKSEVATRSIQSRALARLAGKLGSREGTNP
jgi:RNA polymerase sigma-70 factor, ECF subfamily